MGSSDDEMATGPRDAVGHPKHAVVDAFVRHLSRLGNPGLRVDRRPDEENRRTTDIDAIAGRFAIEHTSVDTLPDQRRLDEWFKRALGVLEGDAGIVLSFRLRISIDFPAVAPGQNWPAILESLKRWISVEAARLPNGRTTVTDAQGVPFPLVVRKSDDEPSGLFLARQVLDDDTLPRRLRDLLARKAAKLAPYRVDGYTTILLVESGDIALMNDGTMLEAIEAAFPGGLPDSVNLLWYADTSSPGAMRFRDFTPELRGQAG